MMIRQHNKQGGFMPTHGYVGTKLYRVWKSMKARCYCKGQTAYAHYGERGIIVCQEWQSFEGFLKWANNSGYVDGLSIERKDSNKNYCPDNCKWIPKNEQPKNRRGCQYYTVNGITLIQSEWARRIGVNHTAIVQARKSGKDVEQYIADKL